LSSLIGGVNSEKGKERPLTLPEEKGNYARLKASIKKNQIDETDTTNIITSIWENRALFSSIFTTGEVIEFGFKNLNPLRCLCRKKNRLEEREE